MHKISDTVNRKFIDTIAVDDFQIEGEFGWVDITAFNLTIEYEVYQLTTTNCYVECADEHIVFRATGEEVFVKDLVPGDAIKGEKGVEYVVSVTPTGVFDHMADITVDSDDHSFYANGLLHHNTVTAAAYLTWYMLFNDMKTVAILANKAAAAREVMSRIQLMIENIPKWLQQGVKEWNKGSIAFENGSNAFTGATSSSGPRGKSISLLYVDETAIIPNNIADEFFASTYPTISSGKSSKIILTSTPLGLNHFWKFWKEAEEGTNGFVPLRIDYWEHPQRDEAWAEEQRKLLGELKFRQEVLIDFLGSSNTLINSDAIQRQAILAPIYVNEDGMKVFFPASKGNPDTGEKPGSYVLVADPSGGVGNDFSAFSIIRIDVLPYVVVARYKNNTISPLLFPSVIHRWATEYNEAMVLVESNKSEQVGHILHQDFEYENIIYVSRTPKGQVFNAGFGASSHIGVYTDKKVKRIGCTMLKNLVEEGKLLIHDTDTLAELSTFIEKRGSYQADEGYHDDLVMTLVLFGWLTSQPYYKELTDNDLRTMLYEARIKSIEEEMLPIGFYNDGNVPDQESQWVDYQP